MKYISTDTSLPQLTHLFWIAPRANSSTSLRNRPSLRRGHLFAQPPKFLCSQRAERSPRGGPQIGLQITTNCEITKFTRRNQPRRRSPPLNHSSVNLAAHSGNDLQARKRGFHFAQPESSPWQLPAPPGGFTMKISKSRGQAVPTPQFSSYMAAPCRGFHSFCVCGLHSGCAQATQT
jgi:hypothetical protein